MQDKQKQRHMKIKTPRQVHCCRKNETTAHCEVEVVWPTKTSQCNHFDNEKNEAEEWWCRLLHHMPDLVPPELDLAQ